MLRVRNPCVEDTYNWIDVPAEPLSMSYHVTDPIESLDLSMLTFGSNLPELCGGVAYKLNLSNL